MKSVACFLIVVSVFLAACDKGLAPNHNVTSLSGKVHFVGSWPSEDSVKTLAVVLVPGSPPYHVPSLIQGVLNNTIKYTELRYRSNDTSFYYELAPGDYGYLGVAQRFSDSIYRDWRSVGFAHDSRDSALAFSLNNGDHLTNIDITVRFDSLPWQPFVP